MTTTPDVLPVVVPADDIPGPPQGCWTYADYAAIPDDGNRYEVIDGVLYTMPSPTIAHQIVVGAIFFYLKQHVEFTGRGRVLVAPVDVELTPGAAAVQPDVIVILTSNLGIVTPSHVVGAPDLVVEVASPSTAGYNRRKKQDAYARAGVPEYWVADPYSHTIEPLFLENGAYRSAGAFQGQALLPSLVVPDFPVPVAQIFA